MSQIHYNHSLLSAPTFCQNNYKPPKKNASPKKGPFQRKVLFQPLCFRGHVSFRGSISAIKNCNLRITGMKQFQNGSGCSPRPTTSSKEPSAEDTEASKPPGGRSTPFACQGGFPPTKGESHQMESSTF